MTINLKKNDIDDLFLNLTENPQGLENKDFRLQLSTIYQLFEDEFEDVFLGNNTPLRGTNFYLLPSGDFFVTPTNNFDFYLKSKGSLYRLRSEIVEINGEDKIGYVAKQEIVWEYFDSFNKILNFDDGTESFNFLNRFTVTLLKILEKLHFLL